jgi:hypothetical protein
MQTTALRKATLLILLALLLVGTGPACRPTVIAPPAVGEVADDMVKLTVLEDGLVAVSRQALAAAGLDVSDMRSDNLHLSQAGTAVPIHVANDTLIFYGQASDDRYTPARTYLLKVGEAGLPMQTVAYDAPNAGAPQTGVTQVRHLEENLIYSAEARVDDDSDLWFWHELRQQRQFEVEVTLDHVQAAPASLRIHLWGFTHNPTVEDDHDFDLVVNGRNLGTVRWDGQTYHTSAAAIPAGLLQNGVNQIVLDNTPEGASFLDIFKVNWLELTYVTSPTAVNNQIEFTAGDGLIMLDGFANAPLIFDVQDPDAPRLLTGWQDSPDGARVAVTADMRIAAAAPAGMRAPEAILPYRLSAWRDADNQADLLIVTTDALAPALEPLVAAREAQGLRVALAPVAEIYDAFGYGSPSPHSIQAFVAYAHANWQPPQPRYLFLVGDATSDYRDYLGLAPENIVPPFMVPVEYSGETVSDSRLADVDGDMRPDLAVGRWPVNTPAQVESLVKRTLAYETETAVNRALFAADGTEAQFAHMAERLAQTAAIPQETVELLNGPQAADLTTAWNNGAWLTTYIGHGSVTRWGKEDVFTLDAVPDLKNSTPSIVLQLTCLTGLFSQPDQISLSEAMLIHPQGPVLLIAATSLTLSTHQEIFAAELLQGLQDPTIERIGDAFQNAKVGLAIENSNGLREISDTFALLGDPSTLVNRP